MKKRTIVFGKYDTADYGWTLTEWTLSNPEQKVNYVEKIGGDGSWDLSTVLSDGLPRYKDRNLSATFECSEGTRDEREELISYMINLLDGLEWPVILPDHPNHYLTARLHVAFVYNTPAHASVKVTGVCEPWFYRRSVTAKGCIAEETAQTLTLSNAGRKAVLPTIIVYGESDAEVQLVFGNVSTTLTAGTYEWADLLLTPGTHELTVTGSGLVSVQYREAVLR